MLHLVMIKKLIFILCAIPVLANAIDTTAEVIAPDVTALSEQQWSTIMAPLPFCPHEECHALLSPLIHEIIAFQKKIISLEKAFDIIINEITPHIQEKHPNCTKKSHYNTPDQWPPHMHYLAPLYRLLTLYALIDFQSKVHDFEHQPSSIHGNSQEKIEEYKALLRNFPRNPVPEVIQTLHLINPLLAPTKVKFGVLFTPKARVSMLQNLIGLRHGHLLIPATHITEYNSGQGIYSDIITSIRMHCSNQYIAKALIAEHICTACTPKPSLWARFTSHDPRPALQKWAGTLIDTLLCDIAHPEQACERLDASTLSDQPTLLILLTVLSASNSIREYPEQCMLQLFHQLSSYNTSPEWAEFIKTFQPHGMHKSSVLAILKRTPKPKEVIIKKLVDNGYQAWLTHRLPTQYLMPGDIQAILIEVVMSAALQLPSNHKLKTHHTISIQPLNTQQTINGCCVIVNCGLCAPIVYSTVSHNEKRIIFMTPSPKFMARTLTTSAAESIIISAQLTATIINEALQNDTLAVAHTFIQKLPTALLSH